MVHLHKATLLDSHNWTTQLYCTVLFNFPDSGKYFQMDWLIENELFDNRRGFWNASQYTGCSVMLLLLQLYFQDYTGSLNVTYMDIRSAIRNCHSDFHIESTFQIYSPITHFYITWPLYEQIHNNNQTKAPIKCILLLQQCWLQISYFQWLLYNGRKPYFLLLTKWLFTHVPMVHSWWDDVSSTSDHHGILG